MKRKSAKARELEPTFGVEAMIQKKKLTENVDR